MRSACRRKNSTLVVGDTDLTVDAGKTSASRQTFVSGNAARLAALDLRRKILALANAGEDAPLGARRRAPHDRRGRGLARRSISPRSTPMRDGIVLEGIGTWDPPTTPLDADGQGVPYATYGFAAQMAEVEVDCALGTVKVLSIVAAHDVGRAINPTLIEGQIHGGIAQGLGLALMEEFIPGRTENLHDYLIPTVGDMPPIKIYLIEDPEPDGPVRREGRRRAGADRHRAGDPRRHPPCDGRADHAGAGPAAPGVGGDAGGHPRPLRGGSGGGEVRALRRDAPPPPTLPRKGREERHDRRISRSRRARRNSARRRGTASCAATPARCSAASGPAGAGACARYANENGQLVRVDPVVVLQRTVDEGGRLVEFAGGEWDGKLLDPSRTFVTGIGAGTTYPDYKPAPFIVSAEHEGVDTVTVVTEGIFSYCGVKVKIDTDRHLGPETAPIRAEGEQVGHVTTAEYGSQMLSIGGVRHLTGGSKKEGNVTCDTLLKLCAGEAVTLAIDGGHEVVVQAGEAPVVDGRPEERMRVGCGSATVGIFAQAMARRGRRGDRGRRPHHRRADRASGRPRARHAASRHPRARAAVDAGPLFPGRQSRPRLGRHRHHRPARRSSRRSTRRSPGRGCGCSSPRPPARTRSIACSTRALRPVPAEMPEAVRAVVERIGENCEPSLCTVLFMAGAGGSLRAGVTDNPVLLTRSVAARRDARHHGRRAGLCLAGRRHHRDGRRDAHAEGLVRLCADAGARRADRVHAAARALRAARRACRRHRVRPREMLAAVAAEARVDRVAGRTIRGRSQRREAVSGRAARPPPPCGEGSGVGEATQARACILPPSPTLPRKGGGSARGRRPGAHRRPPAPVAWADRCGAEGVRRSRMRSRARIARRLRAFPTSFRSSAPSFRCCARRRRGAPRREARSGGAWRRACLPFAEIFITPMAAVAGSVADELLAAMRAAAPLDRAYVNDGGDIAVFCAPGETLDIAIAGDFSLRADAGAERHRSASAMATASAASPPRARAGAPSRSASPIPSRCSRRTPRRPTPRRR